MCNNKIDIAYPKISADRHCVNYVITFLCVILKLQVNSSHFLPNTKPTVPRQIISEQACFVPRGNIVPHNGIMWDPYIKGDACTDCNGGHFWCDKKEPRGLCESKESLDLHLFLVTLGPTSKKSLVIAKIPLRKEHPSYSTVTMSKFL